MCGKKFSIYGAKNTLNLCIFTHAPVPRSKIQEEFFENLVPAKQGRQGGGNYDLFYQNPMRKYEDGFEH